MQNHDFRGKLFRRLLFWSVFLALIFVCFLIVSIIAADTLTDVWWFQALGYMFYWLQRESYRYLVFVGVTIVFFLIFFLNFWLASRVTKETTQSLEDAPRNIHHKILKAFRTGAKIFYGPLSLILSILFAIPLYRHWESFLFYLFGPRMGVQDTYYSKDISFYLFSYPIYTLVQRPLLIAFLILLVGLFILYVAKNRLRGGRPFHFERGAKWHLSLLVLIVFCIEAWDFVLQRYALLYDTFHMPLFYGPGYVQMNVILPFIWASLGLLAATGIGLITVIHFKKGYKSLGACVLLLAAALAARYTPYLPKLVQTYIVKPNEFDKEKHYIAKNIQSTLDAYNLTQVDTRDFQYERFPMKSKVGQVEKVLRNIPVWDAETLDTVFKQLQELRTYYSFPLVTVGRYTVEQNYQQVFLSPRELNYENLPAGAKNWINEHFIYTHGFGAVMTPASQNGGAPMTWFISNIPPASDYGLNMEQPRIYYGMEKYPYAIAPNSIGEMDYPKGNSNVTVNYQGKGGVPIDSLFRRLIFSFYLKDKNLFFSTKFSSGSKILFRRNILERVARLAPYLTLDQTPYMVVTPKGIFWILDAYTTSPWFPASEHYIVKDKSLNYIRNSVKIVVDAFNGTVDFYIFDPKDPIIEAYRRIYPGFFKPMEQMPPDLRRHVRYPKDLFDIQMGIYAKYHQTDPYVYYQQEDLWAFGETVEGGKTVPLKAYYLTLDLIKPGELDFLLLLPMFPKTRDNLRALAIVGCDGDNYGKLIIYNFPKGELVYGTAQIDALINQDPAIAEQFTLWDQAGSSLVRGKMIILPIENSVLFIQPVYLKSTSRVNIPELQRIIMSEGQVVVMETSLEQAYNVLQETVTEELQGISKRFPQGEKASSAQPAPNPPAEQGQSPPEQQGSNPALPIPGLEGKPEGGNAPATQ